MDILSETAALLGDAIERALSQHVDDAAMRRARAGGRLEDAWAALVEQGLTGALIQGAAGFGIPLADGLALVREIGRRAVPLPLAETMIGNLLLSRAGLPTSEGPIALISEGSGVSLGRRDGVWVASGQAGRIAWGRDARALLIEDDRQIALMTSGFEIVAQGTNMARMPRDRVSVAGPVAVAPVAGGAVIEAGALVRALAMAGALETLVGYTVAHVSDRMQFGRKLSAFQAVQHALARLASEAAAAAAAADLAVRAFTEDSARSVTAIAAARVRIGEAATVATGLAHQLHGAIGVTEEHRLHWLTTALWSWRDEFGTTAWWNRRLGREALGQSASTFWPFIVSV